jgi:Transcriptional regulator/sugar kinase
MEGLAAGPAIEDRWGQKAADLKDRPEVWELEAYYIAQAITNYILTLSPNKIILWGGVMHQEQLFPMVRENVKQMLNGYIHHSSILNDMEHYIVAPGLCDEPGIKGALKLGHMAYCE